MRPKPAMVTLMLLAEIALLLLPPTSLPRRAVHGVAWRIGLAEPPGPLPGPPPTFPELLAMGQVEYEQSLPAKQPAIQPAQGQREYPVRAKLLAQPDLLLPAIREHLCPPDDADPVAQNFYLDLLLGLGRDQARAELREILIRGGCGQIAISLREATKALFTDDELKELALTLPTGYRDMAFELVANRDPSFVEAYLLQPRNQTAHVIEYDVGLPTTLSLFPKLSRAGKLIYIQAVARQGMQPPAKFPGTPYGALANPPASLKDLLARESDPAVRQELLYRTGQTEPLLAAIEADGAFRGNGMWRDWDWEKATAAAYPDSFLARGIRAYNALGLDYFGEDRRMTVRGRFLQYDGVSRGYDPAQIPALLAFLQTYSRHEAAGEVAFRLARSYEVAGDYADALRWFQAAAVDLPNGEFAGSAGQRIAWILDAETTDAELAALAKAPALPEALQPAVAYSQALREFRTGRYQEALAAIDAVIARYGEELAGGEMAPGAYLEQATPVAYKELLAPQREKVAKLLALSEKSDAESRYALAAAMFHDRELFANALFAVWGARSSFRGPVWLAAGGDDSPAVRRWAAESNHFIQAAGAFAKVTGPGVPDEIAAKAAYSRALSLASLLYTGSPVDLWQPQSAVAETSANLFAAMAEQYPGSDLAPDALLSVAYLRRDTSYFQRIVRDYPDSNAAVDARLESFPQIPPYGVGGAYWILTIEQAPPEVAAWAQGHLGAAFAGTMALGDRTYALVTAADPSAPLMLEVYAQEQNVVQVRAYVRPPGSRPVVSPYQGTAGRGYVLVDFPKGSYRVTGTEEGSP